MKKGLEKEFAKIVSKNLRALAYDRDKTQADISRDLGIHKATISAWMNGTRTPRMDKIDLLCDYFGCTRSDIMEDHPSRKSGTSAPVQKNAQSMYYTDPETAAKAQELFDDPKYRVLFDAAEGSAPEDLQMAADLLLRLKQTRRD